MMQDSANDFGYQFVPGNKAPEASVQALFADVDTPPTSSDDQWCQTLTKVSLGPNSRHLFRLSSSNERYNYVKLNMYPYGGIARFHIHVSSGGQAVYTSDQHFGVRSNLLLLGRGKDMGDGWEMMRSRERGHNHYVIIHLGHSGQLDHVEIDINHFKGNYLESCELHAYYSEEVSPWTAILPRHKLGVHWRHFFQLENIVNKYFTHVRVTIYPNRGIKCVRVMGGVNLETFQQGCTPSGNTTFISSNTAPGVQLSILTPHELGKTFAPFGQVLMAWTDPNAAPKGVVVTSANQNTAHKYHNLSQIERLGAKPREGWEVKILERHPCTNQAFIPMGYSGITGRPYIAVVALNGQDDRPDLQTLRAFVATASQGIVYNTGVWRLPLQRLPSSGIFVDFSMEEEAQHVQDQ
ncbi:galactose-binding domain-like protein [Gautieria morchelliformis]|nr:galactose-binding domain-like protein [Gautieria morchelliformis]